MEKKLNIFRRSGNNLGRFLFYPPPSVKKLEKHSKNHAFFTFYALTRFDKVYIISRRVKIPGYFCAKK